MVIRLVEGLYLVEIKSRCLFEFHLRRTRTYSNLRWAYFNRRDRNRAKGV